MNDLEEYRIAKASQLFQNRVNRFAFSSFSKNYHIMKRLKPLLKKLALLTFGLLLGLVAAELSLRVIGISYALPYQPDPHTATRLRPNMSFRYIREGVANVQTNSFGYRDIEHSIDKGKEEIRIAILGDSYCEALQVDYDETFWAILQEKLNESGNGYKFKVMNFGVSGFGTAQEYQMLKHYVLNFEPDFVLLGFLSGNDIADNSQKVKQGQIKPYFNIVDDQLVLDDSFLERAEYKKGFTSSTKAKVNAINSFRILQVVNELKTNIERRQKQGRASRIGELGLNPQVYNKPINEKWEEAWQITERLLVEINRECESHEAQFGIVSLSNAIQCDPRKKVRDDFLEETQGTILFYPETRIQKLCESEEIPLVMLAPRFLEVAQKDGTYFHGFENTKLGTGHWNEEGHRLAAEIIYENFRWWLNGLESSDEVAARSASISIPHISASPKEPEKSENAKGAESETQKAKKSDSDSPPESKKTP